MRESTRSFPVGLDTWAKAKLVSAPTRVPPGRLPSMTTSAENHALASDAEPRRQSEAQRAGLLPASKMRDSAERAGSRYLVIGESPLEVWRRPMSQRLEKQFEAEGLTRYDPADTAGVERVAMMRADHFFDRAAGYILLRDGPCLMTMPGSAGRVVPVAAYCNVADADATRSLLEAGEIEASALPAAAVVHDASALPEIYNSELRKMTQPFVAPIQASTIDEIEYRTFQLAYKGVTDFVTKWIYPVPAYYGTRIAAQLGLTPNALTCVSLLLVFVTIWLFATGQFAAGVAVGFLMSYFDTLDGKLARVTQTSTKWGGRFDHAIDQIHPPFWWAAFWWGVQPSPVPTGWTAVALLTLLGYVLVRVLEWRFKKRYRVRIHTWRPFDSYFRQIVTRRNPNLVILGASLLFADAQFGVYAVCFWMYASLAIHGVRFLQAERQVRTRGPLHSWFEQI